MFRYQVRASLFCSRSRYPDCKNRVRQCELSARKDRSPQVPMNGRLQVQRFQFRRRRDLQPFSAFRVRRDIFREIPDKPL